MASTIKFKMDKQDKEVLEIILKDMGLDLDTAFRMFATKVLKTGEIPFSISSNINADTIETEANKRAYKKALKELENGETISLEELKRKYCNV